MKKWKKAKQTAAWLLALAVVSGCSSFAVFAEDAQDGSDTLGGGRIPGFIRL